MALTPNPVAELLGPGHRPATANGTALVAHASALSWSAVFGGAAAAASLSLILLLLGTGLGLASMSPWAGEGARAATLGIAGILWITLTQVVASGMGGYLAGRLRVRWSDVDTDEVFFRDTAHGFLSWSVATLVTAAVLTSTISAIVGTGVQAGTSIAGGVAQTAATATTAAATAAVGSQASTGNGAQGPLAYYVDALFRRDTPAETAEPGAPGRAEGSGGALPIAEVSRIFLNTVRTGALPPEDLRHVARLVAQRTGLSAQDAEKRVADAYAALQRNLREAENAAREAADKARKASAYATLWLFVSLLGGAFAASLLATFGGRRRDA